MDYLIIFIKLYGGLSGIFFYITRYFKKIKTLDGIKKIIGGLSGKIILHHKIF